MPNIILKNMSGEIPKMDPRMLPENAAQIAKNVNLYGGKLAPIQVTAPFQTLHDPDTGKMNGYIPDGSIRFITQPATPVLAEKINWWRPEATGIDIGVAVGLWVTYYDENGVFQDQGISPSFSSNVYWQRRDDGMIAKFVLNDATLSAKAGLYYEVHGLIWGVKLFKDTQYYGGPDADYQSPEVFNNISRSSPEFPRLSAPLKFPTDLSGYTDGSGQYTGNRFQYGVATLIDINAPQPLRTIDMIDQGSDTTVTVLKGGECEMFFKVDYVRSAPVTVSYATAAVDQIVSEGYVNVAIQAGHYTPRIDMKNVRYSADEIPASGTLRLINASAQTEDIPYTSFALVNSIYQFTIPAGSGSWSGAPTYSYAEGDDIQVVDVTAVGLEGPPSELSEEIIVQPKEWIKLTTTRPTGYNRMVLYRSASDASYRQLEDELEQDFFYDTFVESLGEELKPYGNYPQDTLAEAKEGSIVIGGHTAMTFKGEEICPSPPYRMHVYPEKYRFPAGSTVMGGVAFSSSAVIFTATNQYDGSLGKVYRYTGQNAEYASLDTLTEARPLLSKRSLCRIDQTAFYVCVDGLMAVSPSGVQLVSAEFFTREEWQEYEPATMSCYTNDGAVFVVSLAATDPIHFRFDFGEGGATLTRWDAYSDAAFEWKSKKFAYPRPLSWRNIQVIADAYPIEIILTGDENLDKQSVLVPSEKSHCIPRMRKCRNWEITVKGRYTVQKVAVATNVQELNG